ncbi:AAA family ATPase [Arthrobacter sp. NPDC058127]|uniref:AAA family ATPase n=1 Tax=Arthrobacter sp. NPDC058127 TaxID=3346351 RepID=UPI0036E10C83
MMGAITTTKIYLRAADLIEAFDRSTKDGTLIAVNDQTGDVLVHNGALRDARRVLAAHAALEKMPTISYCLSTGAQALNAPGGPKASLPSGIGDRTPPTVAIDIIRDHCLGSGTPHHIQLDWVDHELPADQLSTANGDTARIIEQLADLATNPAVRKGGHVVAIFSRGGLLGQQVAQLPGFAVHNIGLPGQAERRAALEQMQQSERRPLVLAPDFDADAAARATGALRLYDISVMREHTSPESPLTLGIIRERAQVEFERALQGIARVDTTQVVIGRDLVGLAQLRLILEDHALDPAIPIRVAFLGSPGTGKSFAARGLATHLGVPLILPETLKEQWVGASERNGARFLATLESLEPAVTLIDDQNESLSADRERSSHGDTNGISGSLTGLFLDRFGDPTGMAGVHLVIASNYARRLDPAMKSRVKCVAFLPPDVDDLAAQMEATARSRSWDLEPGSALRALLEHPRRLTSRDAVTVLAEARTRAFRAHRQLIAESDVVESLTDYNPGVDIAVERQTLEALEACTFTSHLPWMAARHFGEAATHPPTYLQDFVHADGSLDRDRITERIDELEFQRVR